MNAGEDQGSVSGSAVEDVVAPLPRVTLQAFCETPGVAATMQAAIADRRMDKAHARIHMGGPAAAVEAFRSAPTPNIIVLETVADASSLIGHLDALSESCDAGTKVIVIGHVNDVQLYRDLIRRGVSEYLIAPLGTLDVLKTLSELYVAPGARNRRPHHRRDGRQGRRRFVDRLPQRRLGDRPQPRCLDGDRRPRHRLWHRGPRLQPGSAAGHRRGGLRARPLDANMLDRLLSRCSDNLALLAAPAMLDRTLDLPETPSSSSSIILRATVPCVVLDVPHVWTGWARRALISADEIVVVAAPELASLRNAKNLIDLLRANRPNDAGPKLVLNQVGMPKRPEIDAGGLLQGARHRVLAVIPFDAQLFGTAANNGQMIAEVQAGGKIAEAFVHIASSLTGRGEAKRSKRSLFEPLVAKLRRKA
jgi:pilus assembly protein CpaE